MGLERRGNGLYYYRKERHGERVVSVYAGRSDFGAMFAELDKETRIEREYKRQAERKRRAEEKHVDDSLKELERMTRALVRGVLVAQGYHTHRGQWRKRR